MLYTGANFVGGLILVLLASSCDKKAADGTSGQVSVKMKNATGSGLRLDGDGEFTPTVFGIKLVSVRLLVESSDCTSNACPMVWTADECPATIAESEQDGKMFKYMQSPGCAKDAVTSYFDFAATTVKVNAALNSQNQPILPGTYKYAMLTWSEGAAQTNALRFQADGMDAPQKADLSNISAIISSEADPVTIAEGDEVVVNLDYSLANTIYSTKTNSGNEFCYESTSGDITRCLIMPTFTLTFSKK